MARFSRESGRHWSREALKEAFTTGTCEERLVLRQSLLEHNRTYIAGLLKRIRAAVDTLMQQLNLTPNDLEKILLTGSFGGQVDIRATMQIGMIPNIPLNKVETVANGAGLGAAKFLTDDGFELGVRLAKKAKQVDLDQDPNFVMLYVESMSFPYSEDN